MKRNLIFELSSRSIDYIGYTEYDEENHINIPCENIIYNKRKKTAGNNLLHNSPFLNRKQISDNII